MSFIFPVHKTLRGTAGEDARALLRAQIEKCREELQEVERAVDDGDTEGAAIEVYDLLHAASGMAYLMLRIDRQYNPAHLTERVILKNQARGYYG